MNTVLTRSILTLTLSAALLAPLRAENPGKMPDVKIDPAPVTTQSGTITSFAPIVDKVAPSVVTISTSHNVKAGQRRSGGGNPLFNDPMFRRYFGLPDEDGNKDKDGDDEDNTPKRKPGAKGGLHKESLGLGSGVVVSAEGHILTNNHVIEGADDILVTLANDKHEYVAKKIGGDDKTDIAVLKIDAKSLSPITFADSDKLRVGDLAIAIGNPFGLTQTVSMGIVSALGRHNLGIIRGSNFAGYEDFIQTDASINPGNSGGALVDIEGRLVGINSAIFSRSGGNQGIGFAVPGNLAHSVMDSLIKNGRVIRGFMGVSLQEMDETLKGKFGDADGSLVGDVTAGSPAEKAGIVSGDVITAVNGKKVAGTQQLRMMVSSFPPGTKIDVKLLRGGKEKAVQVELAELDAKKTVAQSAAPEDNSPDVLDGVTVAEIDDAARKQFNIGEDVKGVVITAMDGDSPSAAAGLKVGDVVHEIEHTPVSSSKQAVELSEKLKQEKQVLLRVSTKGVSRFVVVKEKD
jgi:serine protease Do